MFKFTFLGIEFSRNKEQIVNERKEEHKMSHHKLTKQQKKFQKAVKKCHYRTFAPHTFGKCMRRELRK